MQTILLWLLALTFGAAQAAEDKVQMQREAMARIGWLVGEWRGEATMKRGQDEGKVFSWENVTPAAGGLALFVRGRHQRPDAQGRPGDVVHDAAGLITFRPETGKYRFVTHLASGNGGEYEAVMDGDRFKWFIPGAKGTTRFDIFRNAQDEWMEEGYFCPSTGTECHPFFKMRLTRQ